MPHTVFPDLRKLDYTFWAIPVITIIELSLHLLWFHEPVRCYYIVVFTMHGVRYLVDGTHAIRSNRKAIDVCIASGHAPRNHHFALPEDKGHHTRLEEGK